jgi:protein-L-isoaspartate(D-aspartate) O-methyltransferase
MRAALLMICALAALGCTGDYGARRADMVEQLRAYGIADSAVLEAMAEVPRHLFIPARFRSITAPYGDHACPIGHGQTISQPYIVAYMTGYISPRPGERILEVGTGSGYQAAVLAELGAEVYSIEIIPELADHARGVLEELGYDEVRVRTGDGYLGWPEHAPFDAVIVTCAPEEVPEALVEQLAPSGRMILPLGEADGMQRLVTLRKTPDGMEVREEMPVRFVPMVHGDGGD